MVGADQLPKFRLPPLVEVAHGMQFDRLPMSIVHPGLFFAFLRDKYPKTQTMPPLPPTRESFRTTGVGMQQIAFMPQFFDVPRAWFISADDTMLVQLQADRLVLNWRRAPSQAEYPHFETVSEEFFRICHLLEQFVADSNLGSVRPNQCDLTYINQIRDDAVADDPMQAARFVRLWGNSCGDEWDTSRPEDIGLHVRYRLPQGRDERPTARLVASLTTIAPVGTSRALQFEVSVRGSPDEQTSMGVKRFHQMAHENIVNFFAGATTPEAHRIWERLQ